MQLNISVERAIKYLEYDNALGASELARQALEIISSWLKDAKNIELQEAKNEFQELIQRLSCLHPSMYGITSRVQHLAKAVLSSTDTIKNPDEFSNLALNQIEKMLDDENTIKEELVSHSRTLFDKPKQIMTISHSSTISLILMANREMVSKVYVCEARPAFEGRRLAELLADSGISTQIISEAGIAFYMNDVDFVCSGADGIFQDGTFINKIGTAVLAIIANQFNKPFYPFTDHYKIFPRNVSLDAVEMEKKPAEELYKLEKRNLLVENYYFEHIPARYINEYLTNKGRLSKTKIHQLSENLDDLPPPCGSSNL
jgi:translation initiation factor 2B subunit (eIF-2B alpha/beta/delta family)